MTLRITSILLAISTIFLNGCSLPLLVENSGPSAPIDVTNGSTGYVQVMTFENPQTCAEPRLVGYILKPGQVRAHALPAGKVITLSIGAFGLPAAPGHVAWCNPFFLSAKLLPGRNYKLSFEADATAKTCGVRLIDGASGQLVPTVRRNGQGALFSGTMATTPSCEPNPQIEAL